jgi:hypothetical protein
MNDKEECRNTGPHLAHMAINAECPWCGEYDPDQAEFMSVEEAEVMYG